MRHLLAVSMVCAVLATAACGGSDGPTSPSGGGGTGGGGTGGGTAATTITISASGVVSPSTVTITQGGRVTILNNDRRSHEMSSDPHPSHEDCPPLEQIGFLSAGQSKTSGNFNDVRLCGFHDHNLPTVTSLQGRIIVVAQ